MVLEIALAVVAVIVILFVCWALAAAFLFKRATREMGKMQSSFFNDDMDRNFGSVPQQPRRVRGRRLQ